MSTKEEQRAFQTCLQQPNPWRAAQSIPMVRSYLGKPCQLEKGVKFFVLALNALGAKTKFSCEGHPQGFYVTFTAPYKTALRIARAGFFEVEVEGQNYWSLRRKGSETNQPPTAKTKCLTWAAQHWATHLFKRDPTR